MNNKDKKGDKNIVSHYYVVNNAAFKFKWL